MIEIARTYHALGLSVVPVSDTKLPKRKWGSHQTSLMEPGIEFKDAWGLAIVCGQVSGSLELIDIDCKYDLTGELFKQYKQLIADTYPGLLEKLTVQSTMGGGYHFLYKCSEIEGNQKLSSRKTTVDEQQASYKKSIGKKTDEESIKKATKAAENDKVRVLIETRGEGGYFVASPSPGYKLIYGSFDKINTITPEERQILLTCARSFNEVFEEIKPEIKVKKPQEAGEITPLDDYNQRGDALEALQKAGWSIVRQKGSKSLLLRPGGTGMWSADYDSDRQCLYVFTSSTEFEPNKAYSNSAILAHLKFNKDYSATAKALYAEGFGTRRKKQDPEPTSEIKVYSSADFLADHAEMDAYIETVRNGTFKIGLETRIPELDVHFRFKEATLLANVGHDNVGKSIVSWYLAVLSALFHGWKYGILAAENKIGGLKRKLMEFYLCKNINSMTDDETHQASEWVKKHFFIIKNDDIYDYKKVIIMFEILKKEYDIQFGIADPYNALERETTNHHEYDYRALSEMKLSITKNNYGIALNCHAVSEALRRVYFKGHKYEGFPMPPGKADTEGGGKFANKVDDFLTTHRLTQHPHEWMYTDIHVRKIKEMETGGKPTSLDEPVRLEIVPGGCGFISELSRTNPVGVHWGHAPETVFRRIAPEKKKEENREPELELPD